MNDNPSTGPVVRCRDLHKSFTSQAETLTVLDGLQLDVEAAVSCAIMGASGSGKSTLLAIIGGLERFDSGEVTVGTYNLHLLGEKDLPAFRASMAGFVFQSHYLLKDFSALENVALPAFMRGLPRKEAWNKAEDLLARVGLRDRMRHFPSQLSGGERQRAAIARALVNDPAIVLADEPTGNLDAKNAQAIRDLLLGLPAATGSAVLLVTHDEGLADSADKKLRLHEGKLWLD